VGALLAGGAEPQVEGVGKKGPGELEAAQAAHRLHLIHLGLGGGVPALIVLNVAVVAVVLAVADTPACGRGAADDRQRKGLRPQPGPAADTQAEQLC
jgi:hypothetical protein